MGKTDNDQAPRRTRRKVSIRMPADLLERIREIADARAMPLNAILNALLWESVGGRFTKVK